MWAPLNPLAQRAGITEDPEAPAQLPSPRAGNNFDEAKVTAFLRCRAADGCLLREKTPHSSSKAVTKYPIHTAIPLAPGPVAARHRGALLMRAAWGI